MYQELLNFVQSKPIPKTYSQLREIIRQLDEKVGRHSGFSSPMVREEHLDWKINRARQLFLENEITKEEAIAVYYFNNIMIVYINEVHTAELSLGDVEDNIKYIADCFSNNRIMTNFEISCYIEKFFDYSLRCIDISCYGKQSCECIQMGFHLID